MDSEYLKKENIKLIRFKSKLWVYYADTIQFCLIPYFFVNLQNLHPNFKNKKYMKNFDVHSLSYFWKVLFDLFSMIIQISVKMVHFIIFFEIVQTGIGYQVRIFFLAKLNLIIKKIKNHHLRRDLCFAEILNDFILPIFLQWKAVYIFGLKNWYFNL